MYSNQVSEKQYAQSQLVGACVDQNTLTCGENLDRRIASVRAELERLEAVKQEMQDSGLLGLKIGSLRDLMSY